MYLFDLIRKVTRKSNIPVLIYLVLNVLVIANVLQYLFGGGGLVEFPFWAALLIGTVLYAVSLLIALSPVGEWLLRRQYGCRMIKRVEQQEYLDPIFQEVYDNARRLDPDIPEDVKLYINSDDEPNAFAAGRKTICITQGLLQVPEGQLKATLAHEFGHLANKDTDLILVVTVGNLLVTGIIAVIKLLIDFFHFAASIAAILVGGSKGMATAAVETAYKLAITVVIAGMTRLWTWVGTSLVMKSNRDNEFQADAFSYQLGYGDDLCALIETFEGSDTKGVFAVLSNSHPDKNDRIARLQQLGASYRAVYGS